MGGMFLKDEFFMKKALSYAIKGCGWVNPNPMVGAVIVKDGEVIGAGYHEMYGELHAERNALASYKGNVAGATMYVTLEPCCHVGNTPPCTEAIIQSGIKRVVIGSSDPNPLVKGKGINVLRKNNIEVTAGILEEECSSINRIFFHFITTKRPYIVMKYAMTLDGKIATFAGNSKWITGKEARMNVHKDRHKYAGIMVGVDTVIADNPLLTCRIADSKSPIRIICDTRLRTPLTANVVSTAEKYKTIIATCCHDKERISPYKQAGCQVVTVSAKDGHVDLCELMTALGGIGIDSILLEGGAQLNWSAMESGIVNKVQVYLAPKLFGGNSAKSPIGGRGVEYPHEAFALSMPEITMLGDDILLESEVL